MEKAKIGVLGSGVVGQVLANGFVKHDYEVMIAARNKEKLGEWKKTTGYGGQIGSFQETADFGNLLVLTVKGSAAIDAIRSIKKESLKNKTIIDTTNPIADDPAVNGVIRFFTKRNESLLETLQKEIPEARFVKAFNSIGSSFMVNPNFGGTKPTMFICGNNENAKNDVKLILEKFGWEAEDMGFAESAGAIESLCMLWCIPGLLKNQWAHAFKLLKI